MNIAYIILLILLIIYIPFYFYVRAGKLEKYGIVKYGPTVMFKTKWGLRMMDRLARYKRFWRVFGVISKIITLVLMAFMIFIIIVDLTLIPSMMGGPNVGLEYVLAIPGLNPMLPLVYGVIGLVIAMVVHELAHGIQSRANDVDVDSSGILYAVVPIGAFVEPNNEQIQKAERRVQMDMYSAGISTNLVLGLVLFLLMSFGMLGSLSPDYGDNPAVVGISGDSPADALDIPASAIFLDFGDGNIDLNFDPSNMVTVSYLTEESQTTALTATMRMGVYVAGVTSGSVAAANDMSNKYIYKLDGIQIHNLDEFSDFMNSTVPGQSIHVELIGLDGTPYDYPDIVLGTKGDIGFLGVQTNYSGMMFSTPNKVLANAKNPFAGAESVTDFGYAAINYIGSPFRGYSPLPESVQWWYSDSDAFWIAIQTVYWIFWLNLVLAIFNALPAVPFDGGLLFRGGVDWVADKFKMQGQKKEDTVNMITGAMTYIMLFAFALIVVVMII